MQMLDATLLEHPRSSDSVDVLVESRGGLVVYDSGLGGLETLIAASVKIAVATGKALTVVEAEPLRDDTADLLA
ncbi:hypothetical protein [Streptomyces sp. NPDC059788]|uniref:hypothetical protein n=1 Tax=Streptomyces sp. NPDC059788 TaxID=3346948 RepID=UPI0036587B8C